MLSAAVVKNHCNDFVAESCLLLQKPNSYICLKINIMGFIIKVLITAVAAYAAAWLLPGAAITDAKTAIIVALVLALLNTFIKPILVILTIPVTIITLGLFLLVINILIIKLTDSLVGGFTVDGWFSALLFSLIVSLVTWILSGLVDRD
jgi:putative membrane protein